MVARPLIRFHVVGKVKLVVDVFRSRKLWWSFNSSSIIGTKLQTCGAVTFPALFVISSSAGLGLPGSCRPSLPFPPPHPTSFIISPYSALQNYWHPTVGSKISGTGELSILPRTGRLRCVIIGGSLQAATITFEEASLYKIASRKLSC